MAQNQSQSQTKSREAQEFADRIAASGLNQGQAAAFLSRSLGRGVTHYQVSRWISGTTKVPADVLDTMRGHVGSTSDSRPTPEILTETAEIVPLFGYANAAGSVLRLNDEQRLGSVPIHPAQRGSRSAFAFIVSGDSLSPTLSHGDTGYAIRHMTPRKGLPCLIELASGEVLVKLFTGMDERTLFAEQLSPKKELSFPLRDVHALHAVVGVTFG